MKPEVFEIILLNGRPAAGKSEIIDFLKKVPVEERARRFHVGDFVEIDDFPFLWERFEDDDIFEAMGRSRLISDRTFTYEGKTLPGYVFKEKWFWNFLILKINAAYAKLLRDSSVRRQTVFIEFSRGSEHGGFRTAYEYLADEILSRAVTLYIHVPWEESLRKNRRRYNPDRPDSILQHALEDKKMEMLYRDSDWAEFSAPDPRFLKVGDRRVPYAVFDNMPEKTDKPEQLAAHLQEVMGRLWQNQTGGGR
jgi:hypothetical protein